MKVKSLTPSIEPSPRPGWDASVEVVAAEISPSQRQQRWLRKVCLERDQNRCVVSGYHDYQKLEKLPEGHPIKESEDWITTQAAHIVPFCCGSFEKSGVSAPSQIQSLANLIVKRKKKLVLLGRLSGGRFPPCTRKYYYLVPNKSMNLTTLLHLVLIFMLRSEVSLLPLKAR